MHMINAKWSKCATYSAGFTAKKMKSYFSVLLKMKNTFSTLHFNRFLSLRRSARCTMKNQK